MERKVKGMTIISSGFASKKNLWDEDKTQGEEHDPGLEIEDQDGDLARDLETRALPPKLDNMMTGKPPYQVTRHRYDGSPGHPRLAEVIGLLTLCHRNSP